MKNDFTKRTPAAKATLSKFKATKTALSESKEIEILLPIPLVSQNKGRGRHWSVSHKLRKQYEQVIRQTGSTNKRQGDICKKLTITRIVGKGQRLWDLPNVPMSCKELIDALVATENLVDDDAKHLLEASYRQEVDRSHNGQIRIEMIF